MRTWLRAVLFTLVAFGLVWVLKQAFPKNSGALDFFLVFLFCDAFLWYETKQKIRRFSPQIRILLTSLYWLPLILVLAAVAYGFFSTYYYWSTFVKTYLTSFVLVAYLSKSIPILFALAGIGMRAIALRFRSRTGPLSRSGRISGNLFIAGWISGLILFTALMAGMLFGCRTLRIREVNIPLRDLPGTFHGLRIVQISDLHLGNWNSREALIRDIEQINSLSPDLVFITGDLCDYCTADAIPFKSILEGIRAKEGIYFVMGNHDYWDYMTWPSPEEKAGNLHQLVDFTRELGWKLLRNEHDIIRRGTDSIVIAGVENWGSIRRFQRLADLSRALKGVEQVPTTLLLSHDPTYWDSVVSNQFPGTDITFSGHTHGGQIGFEFDEWGWSIVRPLYPHWAGLYSRSSGEPPYLYVNRGLGNIGYAGRIGIWREITLVVAEGLSTAEN